MDIKQQAMYTLLKYKNRWPELCEKTGISYGWVKKFYHGIIKDPGYSKLKKIAELYYE